MKKLLLLLVVLALMFSLFGCGERVENIESLEDYESKDICVLNFNEFEDFTSDLSSKGWITVDNDKAKTKSFSFTNKGEKILFDYKGRTEPSSFIVFNPEAVKPSLLEFNSVRGFPFTRSLSTRGGNQKYAICFSVMPGSGEASDDYIISPMTKVTEYSRISFWVNALSRYGMTPGNKDVKIDFEEPFEVLISTTDQNIESFESINRKYIARGGGWRSVTIDLSQYAGKEISIAIHYTGKADNSWALMLDDIRIYDDVTEIPDLMTLGELISYI